MDKKEISCGIFIDLKKAFDTVDHSILLGKLNHYGIRGIINDWFSSYLSNRLQITQIGSYSSEKVPTTCGVPQGSILGPLLFLIYINDIHRSSKKCDFIFADDTNLLYADKNLKSLELTVNIELRNVTDWLTANKLTLNIKKSSYTLFHPHQKAITYNPNIKSIDHTADKFVSLERKEHIRYLGVIIDSNLSWKYHIDYIALKISKSVGIIAKLRHFVPSYILIKLYYALIQPYITYGISVWGQAAQSHLKQLLILQKRALRLIYFGKPRDHAIPLFTKSNILPLNYLYYESVAVLVHDISNNNTPQNITDLFKRTSEVHTYRTRSVVSQNYYIEYSRINQQKGAFSRIGARLWNAIPTSIRQLNKITFKKDMRKLLLHILNEEEAYLEPHQIIQKVSEQKLSFI